MISENTDEEYERCTTQVWNRIGELYERVQRLQREKLEAEAGLPGSFGSARRRLLGMKRRAVRELGWWRQQLYSAESLARWYASPYARALRALRCMGGYSSNWQRVDDQIQLQLTPFNTDRVWTGIGTDHDESAEDIIRQVALEALLK